MMAAKRLRNSMLDQKKERNNFWFGRIQQSLAGGRGRRGRGVETTHRYRNRNRKRGVAKKKQTTETDQRMRDRRRRLERGRRLAAAGSRQRPISDRVPSTSVPGEGTKTNKQNKPTRNPNPNPKTRKRLAGDSKKGGGAGVRRAWSSSRNIVIDNAPGKKETRTMRDSDQPMKRKETSSGERNRYGGRSFPQITVLR